MTRVALLWHMHQPYYEDLVTREHILPWVRLHALKDYFGMVALLREFPTVRVTFNLVPSLLVQLDAFRSERAYDRYLELGMKPASDLTVDEAVFILQNFFHAQRQRMIDAYPRYSELLALRGPLEAASDPRAALDRFGVDELRDLQVWQKLAWVDPLYADSDDRVRGLLDKGHHFTEHDKATLRTVELEILNAVLPEYRAAAERGQAELSASPFYHPILPLLCDTDVYKRTHPESAMPRHRFEHPEDALEQLTRAADYFERSFGFRPSGLWPSEGSVSDAMVPLVARSGFRWMATDELILARTLGITFTRDARGYLDSPERLYSPYHLRVGPDRVACLFRDHYLSDLIGFTYANWPADTAADDFVSRLAEAGRRHAERTGGGEAVISIILDGENAWEHFPGQGRPFLRALYGRLASHPELTTVTMNEAVGTGGPELAAIFPGSWIDANFYIWIGHSDDQRAWDQLFNARRVIVAAAADGRADRAALARAREELLIAEGSDWYWWYGDDHSSAHDREFDDLFRRHLRNVYRLLDERIPDELFVSNITGQQPPAAETPPTRYITPVLDGEETSYFEWLGAGRLEAQEEIGAMHRAEMQPAVLELVQFGFDAERVYVRLDAVRPVRDLLADGYAFALTFLRPEGLRLTLRASRFDGTLDVVSSQQDIRVEARAGTVLELALRVSELGGPNATSEFFIAVIDSAGHEVERLPGSRPIRVRMPDAWFPARNWSA